MQSVWGRTGFDQARFYSGGRTYFDGSHISRHGTLTQWIDASITDETDPERRDPALDLYGEDIEPPYTQAFLESYRTAQIARNRKITAWVKHKLQELADKGRENEEFAFVTHGTMADPRWLDPAIDPNDRKPGWCYLGEPELLTMARWGLRGFQRFAVGCHNGAMMMPMPTGPKV